MAGTYYLRSFGCQMNEHDAERIRALLEAEGLTRADLPQAADVLVYNTCTVRKSADDRLAGHLGTAARLKRERPQTIVLVTGCLAQAEQADLFVRFPFIDGALGPQNLHRLPELLAEARTATGSSLPGYFADGDRLSGELPARRARQYQAWVQIMSGCTNGCSYCIVPRVRGPERSRERAGILAEVRALVADGVREVTLLGQNVNVYGRDLRHGPRAAPSFVSLLEALDGIEGLRRIRFTTSHPKDFSSDLIAAVAGLASVCEHVHLPVQSGSDRILAAMRRGYGAAEYLEKIAALRAAVPDVSVTTDLIAGFPGETDEDAAETEALVAAARFDAAFTFVYSPRDATAAAALPGQLSQAIKRARLERLIALTQGSALAAHDAWVGRDAEILVEGRSRHGGLVRGRTRQNVTVNAAGEAEQGAIVAVRITAASSTTLRGAI